MLDYSTGGDNLDVDNCYLYLQHDQTGHTANIIYEPALLSGDVAPRRVHVSGDSIAPKLNAEHISLVNNRYIEGWYSDAGFNSAWLWGSNKVADGTVKIYARVGTRFSVPYRGILFMLDEVPALVVDAQMAGKALADMQAGDTCASIQYAGSIEVLDEAWAVFGDTPVCFDTLENGAVSVRIRVPEPYKMSGDSLLSGFVGSGYVTGVQKVFEQWFQNPTQVIHLEHQGEWGQPVQIMAKLKNTGLSNPHIYTYNSKLNRYRLIKEPKLTTAQGYTQFVTAYAGDLVVSEEALVRRKV